MEDVRQQTTTNLKTGTGCKEYAEVVYQCTYDDILVSIKTTIAQGKYPKNVGATKRLERR